MKYDICIIGGAGHVGLPLGVSFANKGLKVALLDINTEWLKIIQSGKFPFKEKNGDKELKKALKNLFTSDDPRTISLSKFVILVVGTPTDKYLSPDLGGLNKVIDSYRSYFKDGQILILRSTLYPGTSERIQKYLNIPVSFCPERIVQGSSLQELSILPQIVSAFDKKTEKEVSRLFKKITKVITISPMEAELSKLFSNAWRYINFAVANQFFMIAKDHKLDYLRIYNAMIQDYPRNRGLQAPGFTAGPCLLKDTLQLAVFGNNNFFLGYSAMLTNEGLPGYILRTLDLNNKTVGILGMAFKADSDDNRDSLSYKLRKLAQMDAKRVLCHDVYIKGFDTLDGVLKCDIVILATPHKEYKKINPQKYRGKFVDIWGFWK